MVSPRTKDSLLWGVVGGLTFLVAIQGYELLTDRRVDLLVKAGVALAVVAVATISTYYAGRRVREIEQA